MERKSKLEHQSGARERSTNGDNQSKGAALDRIYQMEWKRNQQDPWHLARDNHRGSTTPQEKKKYKKDEDSYFEGTGAQKNKKNRRPRSTETAQRSVPPGFSVTAGSSGPPPVNAWSQKKGSALFNKDSAEVDEDDEMLQLVLKESLKTAEQDKMRQLQRIRLLNIEKIPSPRSDIKGEEEEFSDDLEEEYLQKAPVFVKRTSVDDLHFIDTDSSEDINVQEKPVPTRTRKPSSSHQKISPQTSMTKSDLDSREMPQKTEMFPSSDLNNDGNNIYESSRPQGGRSSQTENVNNIRYDTSEPSIPHGKSLSKSESNRAMIIPEKDIKIDSAIKDISDHLKSTLTFGDTQGLLENIHNEYPYSLPIPDTYEPEPPLYHLKNINSPVQEPVQKSYSSSDAALYPDSTETDIMIHNFIRHEPPSTLSSNAIPQKPETPPVIFPVSNAQYLPPHFEQQHSAVGSSSGHESSSPLSDSPSHNVTPYGSFEKQVLPGIAGGTHPYIPYSLPLNTIDGSVHLADHNVTSQMTFSNVPPGYIIPNHALQNAQLAAFPQYRHINPNMVSPALGQDRCNPQLYHPQLQQLITMNALQQYQQHQAQLATCNAPETTNSLQKDQINVLQNQVIHKNLPQVIPTQPRLVPVPTQSHNQNQLQMMPSNETCPKQDVFVNGQQHPMSPQLLGEQQGAQHKTKEEKMLEYQEAWQKLNALHQELAGSMQPAPIPIPIPQPHPYAYPVPVGVNSFYTAVPVMPQVQGQISHHVASSGQPSPNIQQSYPNTSELLNVSSDQGAPVELNMVGRGRGRLQ